MISWFLPILEVFCRSCQAAQEAVSVVGQRSLLQAVAPQAADQKENPNRDCRFWMVLVPIVLVLDGCGTNSFGFGWFWYHLEKALKPRRKNPFGFSGRCFSISPPWRFLLFGA